MLKDKKMTEYRIISITDSFGFTDRWLQFKDIKTITGKKWLLFGEERVIQEKEIWRFIPGDTAAKVFGYTHKSQCPTSLFCVPGSFMKSFHGQEHYDLEPFTKNYPDIDEYFKEMKIKHEEHEKKEEERDDSTILLGGEDD